jgi:methylmalonyl-CoA mutase cobalamin-binding domain/chain
VHILGVSSLAAARLALVPELKAELEKQGRPDIMIVVGGIIPPPAAACDVGCSNPIATNLRADK